MEEDKAAEKGKKQPIKKQIGSKKFISNKFTKDDFAEEAVSVTGTKMPVSRSQQLTDLVKITSNEALAVYLLDKFAPSSCSDEDASIFNKMIAIKAPDGINAVVASPSVDGNSINR